MRRNQISSIGETDESKLAGASVQSTTGSRGVRINGSNVGYTMFRGKAKCTGYPLHSPVSPSLPLPCVTVCHHVSTGLYVGITLALRMNSLPPYSGENKPQRRSVRIFWNSKPGQECRASELEAKTLAARKCRLL
jgi:hypothetical protein